ncbi:inducible T-cell costimulator isoform X1 [Nycticebus coucang]|uniref:inducible T-cell costimulator isoform X1 n=1 Tax=Nycticebus coucang TaxID=9470 RepID=UPI00234D59E6|nr:inducible T-cell costimulator isoform X1 [Nycticebus coucang]
MKSDLWYFFFFCFQIEVATGQINESANYEMFTFHNGGVQVLCKYPETVQQFQMQLLKGSQILCNLTKTKGSGSTVSIENLSFCQPQLSNNGVSFFLYNLDRSHASYYFCKLSIFDPPPFKSILRREYLHIYEPQLPQFCCLMKFWLSIGCAALVIVCFFGCLFTFWLTKKKYQSSVHDPNSEYMFMAAVSTAKKPILTGTDMTP